MFAAILAFVGNGMVILMVASSTSLKKKPQNLLLLNLAVADISCACFGYPMVAPSNLAGRLVSIFIYYS